MPAKAKRPTVVHSIPGRIRFSLPKELNQKETKTLLQDLKSSPEITKATLRGKFLIIEHSGDGESMTSMGAHLNKLFPEFERWSDELDAELAKAVADPWVNKTIPMAILGLALYRCLRDGALLAGESAFALAYVAFDLYWKFQQENVIRKIESGLSQREREQLDVDPDQSNESNQSSSPGKSRTTNSNHRRAS